jgi:hypothetical protein
MAETESIVRELKTAPISTLLTAAYALTHRMGNGADVNPYVKAKRAELRAQRDMISDEIKRRCES